MDRQPRTLSRRYELTEVIGLGATGSVYRARDLTLGRTVAVKVLAPALAEGDAIHVARFQREARAAASLTHPAVVAIYDTGIDGSTRFIVMEHVAGCSLAAFIGAHAPLVPARAARIAEQIAGALACAHAAGLVHRDIKPANVMLGDDGCVKVLDFGLARALDEAPLTLTTSILGTAAYMAPEQALGQPVDERSDIYSLGCVLYAMLVARPPFAGESVAALIHQHLNVQPQSPRELDRRIPAPLDRLVMRMLAKAPDARPQSSAEVRRRLGHVIGATGEPIAVRVPRLPARDEPPSTAETLALRGSVTRELARPTRRRRACVAALACAVLAIAAVIALAPTGLLRGSRKQHAHASARALTNAPSSAASTTASTLANRTGARASSPTTSTPAGSRDAPATSRGATAQTSGAPHTPRARSLPQGAEPSLGYFARTGATRTHALPRRVYELLELAREARPGSPRSAVRRPPA